MKDNYVPPFYMPKKLTNETSFRIAFKQSKKNIGQKDDVIMEAF